MWQTCTCGRRCAVLLRNEVVHHVRARGPLIRRAWMEWECPCGNSGAREIQTIDVDLAAFAES